MSSDQAKPSAAHVLVVGAGLAGLAVARMLSARGSDVQVVERAEKPSEGTGIYLPGNAHLALRTVGLADAVRDASHHIERQVFMDHRGRILTTVELNSFWGGVGPCLGIGRAELHEVMRADGADIRFGVEVATINQDGNAATVEFDDGTFASFDLIVGADGINSATRRLVGDVDPRPVGQVAWRFIVDGVDDLQDWTVRLGRGKTLLTIPIGGGRVYGYLDIGSKGSGDPTGGEPLRLRSLFADFAQPAGDLIEAGLSGGRVHYGPIEEVVTDDWVKGLVVLVGDAAHAMSPNMAQGAAMAFEDAIVLTESLQTHSTVGEGLTAYMARRLPRVKQVRDQTHRRDRIRSLPATIRNASLRSLGRRIYQSEYSSLLEAP